MTTWIAFLRAINLGARRKFSSAAVRAATEAAGFADVDTHINTGNVRFSTTLRSPEKVAAALEAAYLADRGFEVPVVLLTPAEVREVADSLDEVADGHVGNHYVSFLKVAPTAEVATALEALSGAHERVVVRGRAVHLLVGNAYRDAKITNTVIERVAGVATNRNRRVVEAISTKWAAS
ncbi:DUF1697 domain-containing protein [Mariniluteicoccus endophyticus]